MDKESKKLLHDNCVSDYMIELLVVYDYIRIKDISQIDADCLKEIEENVRQKKFSGRFNPDSKAARKKFFGCEDINFTQYSIPFNARRKLLAAAAAATSALNASNAKTDVKLLDLKSRRQKKTTSNESKTFSIISEFTEDDSDDYEPQEKRTKIKTCKRQVKKEDQFKLQVEKKLNQFLTDANRTERVAHDQIKVSSDTGDGIFHVRSQCIICLTWFVSNTRSSTTAIHSLKRHMKSLHFFDNSYRNSTNEIQLECLIIKSEFKEEPDVIKTFNDQESKTEDDDDTKEVISYKVDFVNPNSDKDAPKEVVLKRCSPKPNLSQGKVSKSVKPKKKKSGSAGELSGVKVIEVGGKKLYECKICSQHLKSVFNIKNHMTTHSTDRNFMCDICGGTFKTRAYVLSHQIVHKEKHLSCDLCPKQFKIKFDLREHMDLKHLGGRNVICPICAKILGSNRLLTKHINFHHKEKKNVCEICGFKAISKPKINRHMKSHTGERNFGCEICGKRFLYSYNVQAHINYVHNRLTRPPIPEEKLICTVCGQKFRRVWMTKKHMAEVHNIKDT